MSNRSQVMLKFWSYPKQKLMSHFLKANLKFLDFAPLSFGSRILIYVQENIPAKLLSSEAKTIEGIFIELNFRKKKWLLSCSYNPGKSNIVSHLEHLRRSLDFYSANYDNLLLMGNFNVNTSELNMKNFLTHMGLKA